MIPGRSTTMFDGRLRSHPVQYQLVGLDEPVAALGANGDWNPAYPEAMRRTDLGEAADIRARNEAGARNLQPALLLNPGPTPYLGPPVVGPDGIVDGGSRRLDMLRLAKEGYEAYRWQLRDAADTFGFSPDQVASMDRPVVVRARRDPLGPGDRARFSRSLNTDPAEVARHYASATRVGLQLAGDIRDIARSARQSEGLFDNPDTLRLIAKNLPGLDPEDLFGMFQPNAELTDAGKRRIMAGILSTVTQSPEFIMDVLDL